MRDSLMETLTAVLLLAALASLANLCLGSDAVAEWVAGILVSTKP
jgi:hypothetical protein